jgi:hypothetical protein
MPHSHSGRSGEEKNLVRKDKEYWKDGRRNEAPQNHKSLPSVSRHPTLLVVTALFSNFEKTYKNTLLNTELLFP